MQFTMLTHITVHAEVIKTSPKDAAMKKRVWQQTDARSLLMPCRIIQMSLQGTLTCLHQGCASLEVHIRVVDRSHLSHSNLDQCRYSWCGVHRWHGWSLQEITSEETMILEKCFLFKQVACSSRHLMAPHSGVYIRHFRVKGLSAWSDDVGNEL